MAELPHPWGIYAQTQAQLARQAKSNHFANGLEAGLNGFLKSAGSPDSDEAAMARTIDSGARRSRYDGKLLSQRAVGAVEYTDPAGHLEARADLLHLRQVLNRQDMMLLTAVAEGHGCQHLASLFGSTHEALRARVSRSRRAARLALSQ